MFQTLKAQNGVLGDLEYVVRSSEPASDRSKTTRKQPACARCKMKKLKCIITGAESCEKCMDRGVTCSYSSTGGLDNRSSPDALSSGDCNPDYGKADLPPHNESLQSGASYSDCHTGSSTDNIGMDMDTCPTGNYEDDPCSTFLESTFATQFIGDPSNWTSSLTQDVHGACLASLPNGIMQGDEMPKQDVCSCVDLIIAAHATTQVKFVWATSLDGCTTSSIDDMLQCQKDVLTSCERILGCVKCSLRPNYVVLVISMCREMVDGVRALEVITSKKQQSPQRLYNDLGTTSQAKLEAGGWHLEDDDEIEIIRHLIQVRIKKLRKLTDQLEHTVRANHGSYIWIVSNLRKRLGDT